MSYREYRKRTTAAKVAIPASILIGGSNLLIFVSGLAGLDMDDKTAFTIVTSVYSVGVGFLNFLKNR